MKYNFTQKQFNIFWAEDLNICEDLDNTHDENGRMKYFRKHYSDCKLVYVEIDDDDDLYDRSCDTDGNLYNNHIDPDDLDDDALHVLGYWGSLIGDEKHINLFILKYL